MKSTLNFMEEALRQAEMALQNDCVPVGAVIVCDNKIISTAYNTCVPFEHAELLAIQKAYKIMGNAIREAGLYVTLEPCLMCCGAIALTKIKRVYFGASDPKIGAVHFAFTHTNHKPELYGGICERQSAELLKKFFRQKRVF